MKYLLFLFLFSALVGYGQPGEVELKDLKLPNAPAFNILDYSPTVIDKPGTPKAFTASLVSLATSGSGLPQNFAIEAAPFWFFKNKLTAYSYLGFDSADAKKYNIFSNARNISISLGSVVRDSVEDQPFSANFLAAGIRVNPIRVLRTELRTALRSTMEGMAKRATSITNTAVLSCAHLDPDSLEFKKCLGEALSQAFSTDPDYKQLEERLQRILAFKPQFSVDLALATSMMFKNNTWDLNHHYRTGVWASFSYNIPLIASRQIDALLDNRNFLNVMAIARYLQEDGTSDFEAFENQDLWDVGGKLEAELGRFSVAFESVHRFNSTNDDLSSHRNVGIIQYKVNDNLFLSGSFGENFGEVTNLVALFGLNWGFGKQSITGNKKTK